MRFDPQKSRKCFSLLSVLEQPEADSEDVAPGEINLKTLGKVIARHHDLAKEGKNDTTVSNKKGGMKNKKNTSAEPPSVVS